MSQPLSVQAIVQHRTATVPILHGRDDAMCDTVQNNQVMVGYLLGLDYDAMDFYLSGRRCWLGLPKLDLVTLGVE